MNLNKVPSQREYMLLAVLVRNDRATGKQSELNGRQIAKSFETILGETIPYGTIYTVLSKMDEVGWVRSREELLEGRRTRFYRLTKRGMDAATRWRQRSSTLLSLVDPSSELSAAGEHGYRGTIELPGKQKRRASGQRTIPSQREYMLLAVLVRNDRATGKQSELNGRQIAKSFETILGETIPYGTIYTVLSKMDEDGWVRSREEILEGRRTRFYRLTKRGMDAATRWQQHNSTLLSLVDPSTEFSTARRRRFPGYVDLFVDRGSAPPELIAKILSCVSDIHRGLGGSGLKFSELEVHAMTGRGTS